MLLGSAYFCDLLKPSLTLCKILQEDNVCVVRAMEAILKTSNSGVESGSMVYQGVEIVNYDRSLLFLKNKHQQSEYINVIQDCLRECVKNQGTDLLTHAITILATHGWEKSADTAFRYEALHYISTRFLVPLENASVNSSLLREEWDDIVEFAKRYLNLVQDDYKLIWWKLFNSPDSAKWTDILAVVELLFCLPVSNGHLERVFSQLKLIKGERRTSLGEDRLDQLIRINVEVPALSQWDASNAVELWWQDRTRRLNIRDTRTQPSSSSSSQRNDTDADSQASSATVTLNLENCENWLDPEDLV